MGRTFATRLAVKLAALKERQARKQARAAKRAIRKLGAEELLKLVRKSQKCWGEHGEVRK